MLMLQFSAIPYEKQSKFNLQDLDFTIEDNMLGDYDELSYIYCKPYGFYKTFKLYQKFKKNLVRSK